MGRPALLTRDDEVPIEQSIYLGDEQEAVVMNETIMQEKQGLWKYLEHINDRTLEQIQDNPEREKHYWLRRSPERQRFHCSQFLVPIL